LASTSPVSSGRAVANPEVVLLRAAQPMVGLTRARNSVDEALLQAVVACSPCFRRLVIADARPLANAMAQAAAGKGSEIAENYVSYPSLRDCSIAFLNIGNIHVMRDAEEQLLKLCQHTMENKVINASGVLAQVVEQCNSNRACANNNIHVQAFVQPTVPPSGTNAAACAASSSSSPLSALATVSCPSACTCSCCASHSGTSSSSSHSHGLEEPTSAAWWSALLATGHFEHLGSICRGANFVAKTIASGTSVLVHCSDGWDRTAQLTSLAQLLLDPYFRTISGFFVLLCKEWLSFGHKLTERLGHGGLGGRENSPVLAQFFDCVFQLLSQHPTRFEFKANLLLALRHSLHSGMYGTWLGNSEAERERLEWGRTSTGSSSSAHTSAAATQTTSANGVTAGDSSSVASAAPGVGAAARLRDATPSVFTQLWRHRAEFVNPSYEFSSEQGGRPFEDFTTPAARNNPLSIDLAQLRFWKEYYMPSSCCEPVAPLSVTAVTSDVATSSVSPVSVSQAAVPTASSTSTTNSSNSCTTEKDLAVELGAQRAANGALLAQQAASQNATVTLLTAQVASQEAALVAQQQAQDDALAAQKRSYDARLAEQAAMLEQAMNALAAFAARENSMPSSPPSAPPPPPMPIDEIPAASLEPATMSPAAAVVPRASPTVGATAAGPAADGDSSPRKQPKPAPFPVAVIPAAVRSSSGGSGNHALQRVSSPISSGANHFGVVLRKAGPLLPAKLRTGSATASVSSPVAPAAAASAVASAALQPLSLSAETNSPPPPPPPPQTQDNSPPFLAIQQDARDTGLPPSALGSSAGGADNA
jgi:hypothetical protein